MKRDAFLERLARALAALPATERDEILADYRAYFDDAEADGRSEASVCQALGEPERLARELTAERKLRQWERHKTPGNLGQVLSALAGLSVLNLLLVFPYLIVMTVLSCLWLGALMVLLTGVLFTGGWVSHALTGWPALHRMVINDSGIGPMVIGGSTNITIDGSHHDHVVIRTDASTGSVRVMARDDSGTFLLQNASDGTVERMTASGPLGTVMLSGMPQGTPFGILVVGLVLMLIGGLGSFLGWKVLSTLWRGTGQWLRWQASWLRSEGQAPPV
ncbi:MAG: DUF1700 domain-containing protein [Paludibacterium sp.]|uniref:DUF1700 domain-containing protein n=1 Tax=Paludibacterium sp. TaxID=1917523 RepID=UPI0025CC1E9F|nr:DUF1700 domain-containing protein [Paludibacterium sp.]MBV8045940.1 DUF1700 domain-containing protein [Paludibacterium sp.]MBV8647886.1 DUF1700 domain-containing protein [Paludibacterium sp.]